MIGSIKSSLAGRSAAANNRRKAEKEEAQKEEEPAPLAQQPKPDAQQPKPNDEADALVPSTAGANNRGMVAEKGPAQSGNQGGRRGGRPFAFRRRNPPLALEIEADVAAPSAAVANNRGMVVEKEPAPLALETQKDTLAPSTAADEKERAPPALVTETDALAPSTTANKKERAPPALETETDTLAPSKNAKNRPALETNVEADVLAPSADTASLPDLLIPAAAADSNKNQQQERKVSCDILCDCMTIHVLNYSNMFRFFLAFAVIFYSSVESRNLMV